MILLSFDIEEFDLPLEGKGMIDFEQQIAISQHGTKVILDLLSKHEILATFFSTVVFAQESEDLVKKLLEQGHELGSHTWYHSDFKVGHLRASKEALEKMFSTEVQGFRMPRMHPVDENEIFKAGYRYNSSINPTFLPGRYNHLNVSRIAFMKNQVLQIPASVTPNFRIPLFWLSFHNFPLNFYKKLLTDTYQKDGYINVYFHPWEFSDITHEDFKLPFYIKRNSGNLMKDRLEELIIWLKKNQYEFGRLGDFDFKVS